MGTNHVGGHRGNDKAFTHMHALNTKPPTPPAPPAPPGPTPSPTPAGSCITPNILYDSHKAGNVLLDRQYHSASNSTACQALCHATDACVCFSHRKSLGHCWLMASCQRPEANEMYDSGEANCF